MTAEPHVEERELQPYAGITKSVSMDSIGAELPPLVPEIFAWLAERGIEPAGAPFFRYDVIDMDAALQVQVGVPVRAPVDGDGRVIAGSNPAGRYVTLTHVGPPAELAGVTGRMLDWAAGRGLVWDRSDSDAGERWGCRLEIYQTDPRLEPDQAKWSTTLAFRLAD
jgi:effector-binding domain-containing protein